VHELASANRRRDEWRSVEIRAAIWTFQRQSPSTVLVAPFTAQTARA
jgi:hypothetical protein